MQVPACSIPYLPAMQHLQPYRQVPWPCGVRPDQCELTAASFVRPRQSQAQLLLQADACCTSSLSSVKPSGSQELPWAE